MTKPTSGSGDTKPETTEKRAADVGAGMWAHILHDQLDVDEATFWATARDGVKPTAPGLLSNRAQRC